ncbi:MAG: hypothetical protein V4700_03275 [Pseudomonadota bacterium]
MELFKDKCVRKRKSVFFIFFLMLLILTENASAIIIPPFRLSVNGYASDSTVGQADVMLSLEGDQDHNFYVNPNVSYGSDNQGFTDLGVGYRWIQNDAAILGGYIFAGHTRLDHNSGFWIANPGIEAMGSRWDVHLNAYIPLAGRSDDLGSFEFNIISDPVFRGHSLVVDSVFNTVHEMQRIGNGADARLAYQLFRYVPLKAYVGAYFFDIPDTAKLRGGAAGFEYWFNRQFKFFANYTYDNVQHSTVATGLGISFGGVRKQMADPSLSERLMDPVERHLANLGHASGIPSRMFFNEGNGSSSQILLDNIAFFSQAGMPNNGGSGLTLANCTFENPCGPTDLTNVGAITLNTLLPNTTMYFNGGSYDALNVPAGTNAVTLQAGQSVHSRSADYSQPATGANRSTFDAAFILNSNNTLENIILQSTADTVGGNGVFASNASNLLITGSQIGSTANPFMDGVRLTGTSQMEMNNSQVFSGGSANNNAFFILDTSQLSINDTQINVTSPNVSHGVVAKDSSTLFANHIIMNITMNSLGDAINAQNNSTIRVSNATFNVNGSNGNSRGIRTTSSILVFVNNTTVNVAGIGNNTGLNSQGSEVIQFDSGDITVIGGAGSSIKEETVPGSITITNSTCSLNGVPGCPP